eukprot:2300609-Rhodomonas_salina.1
MMFYGASAFTAQPLRHIFRSTPLAAAVLPLWLCTLVSPGTHVQAQRWLDTNFQGLLVENKCVSAVPHPQDQLVAMRSLQNAQCVVGQPCSFDVKIHGLAAQAEYTIAVTVAKGADVILFSEEQLDPEGCSPDGCCFVSSGGARHRVTLPGLPEQLPYSVRAEILDAHPSQSDHLLSFVTVLLKMTGLTQEETYSVRKKEEGSTEPRVELEKLACDSDGEEHSQQEAARAKRQMHRRQ